MRQVELDLNRDLSRLTQKDKYFYSDDSEAPSSYKKTGGGVLQGAGEREAAVGPSERTQDHGCRSTTLAAVRAHGVEMRIVITGGAGFLGSNLCDRLLDLGNEVICLDNLITGSVDNIAHLMGHPRFRFVKHDVTEYIFIGEPVDAVMHFASPASPRDYLELPIQTLKVGALGTHKTLGLAKNKRARFLLASTSETYGDPLVNPQPETLLGEREPDRVCAESTTKPSGSPRRS